MTIAEEVLIRHLFMDERFAHPKEPISLQATSLSCALIDPAKHHTFRKSFYELLAEVLDPPENTVAQLPAIHAMDLFPEGDDDQRIAFLQGLVDLAVKQGIPIYRIGYRENRHFGRAKPDEREVLRLCFSSLQFCLQIDEPNTVIWPVMELDRAYGRQDVHFPGSIQYLDWMTQLIGRESLSIDNRYLGEVLFHSKQSAYGAFIDCLAYLLHIRFRRTVGEALSPFKAKLAAMADLLDPVIKRDEIIDIQIGQPPAGYSDDGPIRWMFPITPRD